MVTNPWVMQVNSALLYYFETTTIWHIWLSNAFLLRLPITFKYRNVSKHIQMYRNVSNVTRMGEKQLSNYKKVRGRRDGSVITTIDEKYGGMY